MSKPEENHYKIAEYLELAAKHHREAAKHHEGGDHREAAAQAYIAHGHLLRAKKYQDEATIRHTETHSVPIEVK